MKHIFGKAFMKAFGTITGIYAAIATMGFINSSLSRKTENNEASKKDSVKEDEIQ